MFQALPAVGGIQLLSSVDMLLKAQGQEWAWADRLAYDRNLAAARTQVDSLAFDTAWLMGQVLQLEQAIPVALAVTVTCPQPLVVEQST